MSSKPDLNTLDLDFNQHCAGRYQIELPADMKQTKGSFAFPDIGLNVNASVRGKEVKKGIFRGKGRLDRWLSNIEEKRVEDVNRKKQARYVLKDIQTDKPVKTVAYYKDLRKSMANENAWHAYAVFFFKDFPKQELGLTIIQGLSRGTFDRDNPNYKQDFSRQLTIMQEKAQLVNYVPWPHERLGVCINDELIFEQPTRSEKESYLVGFFNGKRTHIEIDVTSYGKKSGDYIARQIKQSSGLLSIFASTSMKVAGRKGKLFISGGFEPGSTEFRWFSTDTKPGSVRFAHIEINGTVTMSDYPELTPLNGTEFVYGMLKSISVRKNGMFGID